MKKLLTFLLLVLLVSNTLWGQLSGTLTVGTGGNYATLGAAITDLNTVGVSGPVTFSLTDTAYTETATDLVIAPTLNPPSASASVTIKPAASIKPVVTISGCTATSGASQYSGFSINGAGNITIDGSNTVGGTTKDLTFVMNDATNGRNIIQLYGNCDTVTIKNTNLTFQTPMSTSTSTRGIYANGQATGAVDNFTVQNCSIGDATNTPFYAIGVTGSSSSSIYCTNVALKNNSLYGRIRPAYFFYVGSTGNTSEITGNTISTIGGLNASTTYSILMNTWGGTVNIQNNFIPTLTTNHTATSGIYGISGLTAQTGATCNIINNFRFYR